MLRELKYHQSPAWPRRWKLFNLSVATLFVLADKYEVPQLRDDILTAFLGRCWKWNWWPEEEPQLIDPVYNNLPASSGLTRLIACSIAWTGFYPSAGDPATKMRSLHSLNLDLALDVGIVLATMVQQSNDNNEVTVDISTNLPNACLLHDHEELDEKHCRQRIASRPHVFAATLDACVRDVMASASD